MTSEYAPKKSVRPRSKSDGRAAIADAKRQRALMAQMGDIEVRADLDPYLRDDPLARLGYKVSNLMPMFLTDSMGAAKVGAQSVGGKRGAAGQVEESFGPNYSAYFRATHPERDGEVRYGDVMYGDGYASLPVLAHELRHLGIAELRNSGLLPQEPIKGPYTGREFYPAEEAMTELGDTPFLDERFNRPRRQQAALGESYPLSDTIEGFLNGKKHGLKSYTSGQRSAMEDLYKVMQQAAQEELTRQGEPPRTEPQYPTYWDKLMGLFK